MKYQQRQAYFFWLKKIWSMKETKTLVSLKIRGGVFVTKESVCVWVGFLFCLISITVEEGVFVFVRN